MITMAETGTPEHTAEACRKLTRAMKGGDESAWRVFHDRYCDFLLRYARSRGARGEDAYDLVQRTYLRILRHIRVIGQFADLEAWMRCLMRCEVIDLGRSGARRTALMEKYAHWLEARRDAGHVPGRTADELLEGLSEEERSLMTRCYVEGWTHQELAELGDTTPKAIESKLARLRRKLRAGATSHV